MKPPHVFLTQPSSCNKSVGASAFAFARASVECDVFYHMPTLSLLTTNFNTAWCAFLNDAKERKFTHFAMIHSDIIPLPMGTPWLDRMIEIMDRVNADLLSAIVPIKNQYGLTSTAFETGDDWKVRRLTLTEIFQRSPTFTHPEILANTGLWVCRYGPWCEKVCFRQHDKLVRDDEGKWSPATIPEDWDFSRQVRELGKRIFVTREIVLQHEFDAFHNESPWGEWTTDQDAPKVREEVPLCV